MSGVIAQATPSSDEEYHSPAEREDTWAHSKDIGFGGFGVVKLFVNQTTGEKLVLKECRLNSLSPDFMERWYGELKIIKRLHHANVVRALDVPPGLHYEPMGNVPFICMEYCDKGDLRQVLRDPDNCCGLTEEQIRRICSDVNAGIRFLHSQKVIHRDLKPENILVKCTDGKSVVYKLTDFGYSKSYDQNSVCTSLVGTMQYVAPEVIKSRLYHSSVDFWSFGVVVFECITGRRPFLHGIPSNNIAWIDFVAKKQPDHIHIYYSRESQSNTPTFSSHIPTPHRLSKTFESLMTSWLQTALHYNPEMRGGRRRGGSEDAPCLSNMDHILSTKVVSLVCMATGEEYYFKVDDTTTYDSLKQQVPSCSSVPSHQHFQILLSGHMPQGGDLVGRNMQGNIGRVYSFNTVLEPSFKMMHTSSEAVSTITAYGDKELDPRELREVYAEVFFHVREYYTFFKRLQEGHSAMLYQLTQCCKGVQDQQSYVLDLLLVTKEVVGLVAKMHVDDSITLKSLLDKEKVPSQLSEYFELWQNSISVMKEREMNLHVLSDDLSRLREETNSYICMVDDLQSNYDNNYSRLEDYRENYVAAACELYQEVKSTREFVKGSSMQDVLLRCTQEAQSIIEECLNGYNYGQTFLTLTSHLQKIQDKRGMLERIRMDAMQMKDRLRENLWDIIVESNCPVNSFGKQFYRNSSYSRNSADGAIAMNIDTSSNEPGQSSASEERSNNRRLSAEEMRRQFSNTSLSSVESVNDPNLVRSIQSLQRNVSEEENSRLIHKSKELRMKFESLSRSSSTTEANGKLLPMMEAAK